MQEWHKQFDLLVLSVFINLKFSIAMQLEVSFVVELIASFTEN